MSELMWGNLKIQTIHYISIMRGCFTEYWMYCVFYFLPIDIAYISTLFIGARNNILPYTFKLRIG